MYGKNLHNFTLKYVPDRDLPGAYRNDLVEQKEKRLFPPEEKYYCQYRGSG